MLPITIPASGDMWDPVKEEFVQGTDETTIVLEHSLISISKWEEIYEKPFIGDGTEKYDKTPEEILDYIKCMTITPVNDERIFNAMTKENVDEVTKYIYSKRSATVINYLGKKEEEKKEIITSELVYCWMTLLNIPFKCAQWHINRLLNLIELCSIKNDPNPKKMNPKEYAAWRNAENQKRRALKRAKH